jgi:hypothetical protein
MFIFVLQIEAENHCTSQMRSLIDQISLQQGRIVALEGLLFIISIFQLINNLEYISIFILAI